MPPGARIRRSEPGQLKLRRSELGRRDKRLLAAVAEIATIATAVLAIADASSPRLPRMQVAPSSICRCLRGTRLSRRPPAVTLGGAGHCANRARSRLKLSRSRPTLSSARLCYETPAGYAPADHSTEGGPMADAVWVEFAPGMTAELYERVNDRV